MKIDEFRKKVQELGVNITKQQEDMLEKYYDHLKEYNEHTNLTAITEKEDVYLKHFYDSLTIVKAIKLDNQSLIDIGTGAGFPGLVLKIMFPNLKITLLDSNNKKTAFLREMIAMLNLQDIEVVNSRAEDYAKQNFGKYDICVSRAVAFIDIISSLTLPLIKEDGVVVLMKGNFTNEQKVIYEHQKDLGIKEYNIVNFTLPNLEDERNLVVLKREKDIKILEYNFIAKRHKKWSL